MFRVVFVSQKLRIVNVFARVVIVQFFIPVEMRDLESLQDGEMKFSPIAKNPRICKSPTTLAHDGDSLETIRGICPGMGRDF
jgi:hypothetical protein